MAKSTSQSERRIEPRVRAEGLIGVRITDGERVERGNLFDINNHGAYVATGMDIGLGRAVILEIEIPGAGPLEPICAEVVRRKDGLTQLGEAMPSGLGLKFLAHSRADQDRIQVTVKTTMALDLLDPNQLDGVSKKDPDKTAPVDPSD